MSKKYVLIVEDDQFQMKIFDTILKRLDCKTLLLSKGKEALEFLSGKTAISGIKNEEVGLVLLDLAMPDISGITILQQLQNHSHIPIAILSASEDLEIIIESIKLGADNFLIKGKDEHHLKRMCDYVERMVN